MARERGPGWTPPVYDEQDQWCPPDHGAVVRDVLASGRFVGDTIEEVIQHSERSRTVVRAAVCGCKIRIRQQEIRTPGNGGQWSWLQVADGARLEECAAHRPGATQPDRDIRPIPSLVRLVRAVSDAALYDSLPAATPERAALIAQAREDSVRAAVDLLAWDGPAEAEREVRRVFGVPAG